MAPYVYSQLKEQKDTPPEDGDVHGDDRKSLVHRAWSRASHPFRALDSARILGVYIVVLSYIIIQRAATRDMSLTHFTYWGLLLSLVLALAWVRAMVLDKAQWDGRTPANELPTREGVLMLMWVVPTLGVLLCVATLITAMPILDVDIVETQGGDTSLALINVGNIVIHYIPPVTLVVVIHMRWAVFVQHLAWLLDSDAAPGPALTAFLSLGTIVVPLVVASLYSSVVDFNTAYGVNVSTLTVDAIAVVTVGVYAALMKVCYDSALATAGGPLVVPLPSHSPTALVPYVLSVGALFIYRLFTITFSLHHFPYWGLGLSGVFATVWLVAIAVDTQGAFHGHEDTTKATAAEGVVLLLGAVPTLGVLFSVTTLITAVPMLDISIVDSQGEGKPLGIINAVNLAMHYVPPTLLLFAIHMRWPVFAAHLKALFTEDKGDPTLGSPRGGPGSGSSSDSAPTLVLIMVIVQALVLPMLIANLYNSTFDFNSAYGVDINPMNVVGVAAGTFAVYSILSGRAFVVSLK